MTTMDDHRQAAIRRIGAKRELRLHLAVYLVVNTMLIVIWAATGAGYFWPIWPIGGWAIGLAFHALTVYFQRPVTEDDIEAEMRRQRPDDTPRY
ncbi:MAG: 2TM domain-containing protein [Acidimicrobiia bacterium]|nr:2TM domain-containing protein [Acidimicrobiia bacterium]